MIAVVDYGMGNLHSVQYALDHVGADVEVVQRPERLRAAERIVLPGVGTFAECVKSLHASGLMDALEDEVVRKGKPFFGICLGMQVLARLGCEGGIKDGLAWIGGEVRKFDLAGRQLKVPHVGWNKVTPCGAPALFQGFRKPPAFYFVHSYHFVVDAEADVAAKCNYGIPFTAAVARANIFATQFHPEKSQQDGLRLLENFLRWKP